MYNMNERDTRITQKFVLCQLPPQWEVLPVHRGPKPPSHPNSIAVYTNNGPNSSLIYKGYICPSHPTQVPMTSVMPPTEKSIREQLFESRYLQLVEKVRAKDSEAQAQARNLTVLSSQSNSTRAAEAQTRSLSVQPSQVNGNRAAETPTRTILVQTNQQSNNRKADSTTCSTTRQIVVKAEASGTQNQEDGSSNKVGKPQNSSYPLPYDILSGGESFLAHEEPWGNPEEEDVIEMITL
ncbi:uncharacterized protein LOC103395369 isoform X3 [Cynoglossus semilaevis]|uniref:uncharacterized protein LOC103395369 isoform X3 n=2 Tax=Cynoglossus semilaevis TaxID=244447 RepID=UPI000498431C|nr:uncharacterized protein LOC103395369 isoform X3 [Cynoglossus semilaevis]